MTEASDRTAARTRESTRGVAIITLAKAYFLLTGFAQPLLLTRLLGPAGYGLYGAVLNSVSILNNVVVAGSIQAMSKSVTEVGGAALRRGLVLHVALGALLASSLALLAEPLGVGLLGDPQLPPLLRVAAVVVGNYSVYAALVGALNGQRRFVAQAGLDMTFATFRTALVIGLAATAWKVAGAVAGFALASTLILAVALVTVWRRMPAATSAETAAESFGGFVRRYGRFFAPVLLYQLALNMVLQSDLLVLKALLARRAGTTLEQINALVGIYKSVQNFAFLPYQLLLAVTFVVFPVVTLATREGDRETTQRLVRGALRFSTLALGAMLAILAGLSRSVLLLAYPPAVAVGAGALRVLSIGQAAFALSVITTTIVLAAGRTAAATALMCGMLGAVFTGDVVAITLAPVGVASLDAAALGTAAGCFCGLLATGLYARRLFGAFVPPGTLLRAVFAGVVAATAVALVPLSGKVVTLALSALALVVYLVVLLATGEVGREERAALERLVRRRRG